MIGPPVNDHECLGPITDIVSELVEQRAEPVVDVARRHREPRNLAAWIRSLPQRNDEGDDSDGPRVQACEPTQRLRIPAPDPNCVERAALYIGAAELIAPHATRQLATIDTHRGPHTIALEGGVPVILDPRVTRNAMEAGLFRLEPGPIRLSPSEAVGWLGELAEEPAGALPHGRSRVRNGCGALRGVLRGQPISVSQARDAAMVLHLGEREAQLFGPHGIAVARCTIHALGELESANQRRLRNVPLLRIGRRRIKPNMPLLGSLARVSGRLGYRVGTTALRVKLASMGITGPMIGEVEHELNREGLSLGEVAKPPPRPGTLAALAPTSMAGYWLANKT